MDSPKGLKAPYVTPTLTRLTPIVVGADLRFDHRMCPHCQAPVTIVVHADASADVEHADSPCAWFIEYGDSDMDRETSETTP